MPPTTQNLLEEMAEKGLQKVAHKDLVKGCDYLIVYPGVDSLAWAFKLATYVEEWAFKKWRDYERLDKDGDPLFSAPQQMSQNTKLNAYGAAFYTYNPFKCDAAVKNAKRHFNTGRNNGRNNTRRRNQNA
jgi:hypothetical protein